MVNSPDFKSNLQAVINAGSDLSNQIVLGTCLKDRFNRSIWGGTQNGASVIVKHYKHSAAADQVEKEVFLVLQCEKILGVDTPARAPKLLLSRPDLGFYCLEKCPGIAGDALLIPDDPPMPFLMPRAAFWLGVLVKKTSKSNNIVLNYWRDVVKIPPSFPLIDETTERLYTAVMQKTLGHLQSAAGEVTKSVLHGDFQPGNLLISDDLVYGIDFQSKNIGIVVREIACFLIRTNAKSHTSGALYGFDDAVIAPFRRILPEGEIDRLLPVFIGVELMSSFKNDTRWTARTVRRRNALAQRYIDS